MRFELNKLLEYTDEAILTELQRVANLTGCSAMTAAVLREHARVGLSTIRRHFGTLDKALRAAGLADRSAYAVGARGAHASQRLTNDDILSALRTLAGQLNKTELTVHDVEKHLPFTRATLSRRWGTAQAAFRAAGLGTNKLWRRYTDDQCFENLLAVWTHYGRAPTYSEIGLPPSQVGAKAYISRFGSWRKALAAFVERANQDPDAATPIEPRSDIQAQAIKSPDARRTTREMPLGLRFRVLRRDLFKCVLCGDNPPLNPSCVLHIDHVMPWSKGGATEINNLRTLCAACNLGRGNRYED